MSIRLALLIAAGFLFLLIPVADVPQTGTISGMATITGTDFIVHVQVLTDGAYAVTGLPADTYFVRFHTSGSRLADGVWETGMDTRLRRLRIRLTLTRSATSHPRTAMTGAAR